MFDDDWYFRDPMESNSQQLKPSRRMFAQTYDLIKALAEADEQRQHVENIQGQAQETGTKSHAQAAAALQEQLLHCSTCRTGSSCTASARTTEDDRADVLEAECEDARENLMDIDSEIQGIDKPLQD